MMSVFRLAFQRSQALLVFALYCSALIYPSSASTPDAGSESGGPIRVGECHFTIEFPGPPISSTRKPKGNMMGIITLTERYGHGMVSGIEGARKCLA